MDTGRRAEQLMERFLEGSLDAAGREEFHSFLRGNPALAARLEQHLDLNCLLAEFYRAGDFAAETVGKILAVVDECGEETVRKLDACTRRVATDVPARARRIPWGVLVPVAACLALVVGALVYLAPRENGPAGVTVARIRETASGVTVFRADGRRTAAAAGMDLCAGDRVETKGDERVVLAYPNEETTVTAGGAGAETDLTIRESEDGRRLHLAKGVVDAAVAPGPAGVRMVITTPHATARVPGTRFTLGAGADAAWLDVKEGSVRLRAAGADFERTIAAGRHAVMGGGRFARRAGGSLTEVTRFDLPPKKTLGYAFGAAFDGTSLWICDSGTSTLFRFSPEGRIVGRTAIGRAVSKNPTHIAWDGRRMWVRSGGENRDLFAVSPETGELFRKITLPFRSYALAYGGGSLWCSEDLGEDEKPVERFRIHEIDPDTGGVRRSFDTPIRVFRMAWREGALWTYQDARFRRFSPVDGRVQATIDMELIHHGDLAPAGGGRFWIVTNFSRRCYLLDTGEHVERYEMTQ